MYNFIDRFIFHLGLGLVQERWQLALVLALTRMLVVRSHDLVLVAVLWPFQFDLQRLVVAVGGRLVLILLLMVVVVHVRLPATNHRGYEVKARVRLRLRVLLRGL